MARLRWVALALLALVALTPSIAAAHAVNMTEAKECPAPTALGRSATGVANINTDTNKITYDITYSHPADNITGAHLHGFTGVCPSTAGVKFVLTSVGPGHFAGEITYLEADEATILAGNTYFNIHKDGNSGQVRDQFAPQTPAYGPVGAIAGALLLVGGGVFAISRRRRVAA